MTRYFILAILIGFVLKWIGTAGVSHYVRTGMTDEQLREHKLFHVSVMLFLFASFLRLAGLTLLAASLIKTYILS